MAKAARVTITWSDELEECAEAIVQMYAEEMEAAGIMPKTRARPGGELSINRSGAITFALMKLAERGAE